MSDRLLAEIIHIDYRASQLERGLIHWFGRVTSILISLVAASSPSSTLTAAALVVGMIGCIVWQINALINSAYLRYLRKAAAEAARTSGEEVLHNEDIRWRGEYLEKHPIMRKSIYLFRFEPFLWAAGLLIVGFLVIERPAPPPPLKYRIHSPADTDRS